MLTCLDLNRWAGGLKRWRQALLIAGLVGIVGPTGAITLTVTDPSPTLLAERATCTGAVDAKAYVTCKSTATIAAAAIGGGAGPDPEFKKSFDAWNAGLAADSKWTLVSAGALPGGSFKVTTFDAYVGGTLGGVEINVTWDYDGFGKDMYFWTQGLLDNYTLSPLAIVAPFYEMDNAGSTTTALYPFQYPDKHFYDKPAAPLPNGSFIARAMLARADTTFRTLTSYEGVAYSFALSAVAVVPEPGRALLSALGLLAVVAWARRLPGRAVPV